MAQRAAVANGNWSLASTWNGGVLPGPGDIVGSNGFAVTIDQNINVDSLANAAVALTSAVPVMTSNTTPSGVAASSGVWTNNPAYEAWTAFNSAQFGYLANLGPFWLSYEFTTARVISSYAVGATTNGSMRDWTFEAWNGASWVVLHTVTNYLAASWSSSGYTSPNIGNTTAYIRYRFNCTAINTGSYVQMTNVRLFEIYSSASVAGGGFTLTGSHTVTLTNTSSGLVANTAGPTICLTYNGTGNATVNANIYSGSTLTAQTYMLKSGNGILNFNGILDGNSERALFINNNCGITNIVGTIRKTGGSISTRSILGVGTGNTINITGNVETNVTGGGNSKQTFFSNGSNVINITGNVTAAVSNQIYDFAFIPGTNDIITVVGSVIGPLGSSLISYIAAIGSVNNPVWYLKVIGSIIAGTGFPAIQNTNGGAINIFTGPFISSANGIQPFYVARMHYQRTLGSYYEFRDSSTNGALPPAANAPTTRLNSPEVGSDLPTVANVRFGTTYGYGSLVGTLRMPTANQVTYGVAVDNTFGAAVLTAASVWDYLVDNITTANSIGLRLKNVSTPQTVGSQLASLL